MKNKSLKILLSLTIISCLLFTACGTDETIAPTVEPTSEQTVESESAEESEPESIVESDTDQTTVDEYEAPVEEVEEDTKVVVDSTGSDAEFTEEDEYVEPTTNNDLDSQLDALEDMYRQKYENGEIDEDYYQDMLDAIEKERKAQ